MTLGANLGQKMKSSLKRGVKKSVPNGPEIIFEARMTFYFKRVFFFFRVVDYEWHLS